MRPTWNEYFMQMAELVSTRSHDSETKVGSVIVKDKKVIGMGYNGFPSDTEDSNLPTIRPDKYPYMIHSELNSLSNLVLKPDNAVIYVTRIPCNICAKLLWQNNIREWFVPKECNKVNSFSKEDELILDYLIDNGLVINYI